MVVGNGERPNIEGPVSPGLMHINDGEHVTVHDRGEARMSKGIIQLLGMNSPEFVVLPRLDMNGQEMGSPMTVSYDQLSGENPQIKLY